MRVVMAEWSKVHVIAQGGAREPGSIPDQDLLFCISFNFLFPHFVFHCY